MRTTDLPILLRRYFPVSNDFGANYEKYIYVAPDLHSVISRKGELNIHQSSHDHRVWNWNCSSSYLIIDREAVCLTIKVQTFVFNSKPWSYTQNLYVFPPSVNRTFINLWKTKSDQNNFDINSKCVNIKLGVNPTINIYTQVVLVSYY